MKAGQRLRPRADFTKQSKSLHDKVVSITIVTCIVTQHFTKQL